MCSQITGSLSNFPESQWPFMNDNRVVASISLQVFFKEDNRVQRINSLSVFK